MEGLMHYEIDPYQILQISRHSTNEEIKDAYHKKIASEENAELYATAYALIKNEDARKSFDWFSVFSYFEPPLAEKQNWDFEKLAKELAFLSDWEMG